MRTEGNGLRTVWDRPRAVVEVSFVLCRILSHTFSDLGLCLPGSAQYLVTWQVRFRRRCNIWWLWTVDISGPPLHMASALFSICFNSRTSIFGGNPKASWPTCVSKFWHLSSELPSFPVTSSIGNEPWPHTPTKKAGQEECNEKQCCHEDVYRFSIIFLVLLHNFQKPWISDKTEWDGFEIATCLSHLIRISQKIFRSCLDFLTTFIYIRPFVLQSSWQWDGHHQACSPSGNIVETGKSYNIKICPCSHMYTYDYPQLVERDSGIND